jgi:hypothetical protein
VRRGNLAANACLALRHDGITEAEILKAYTDLELAALDEHDAPGIDGFRASLDELLGVRPVERLPHGEIVRQLASTAENFRVLVLKSRTRLPYTSVFLQLDCAYWSDDAEARLRARLGRPAR